MSRQAYQEKLMEPERLLLRDTNMIKSTVVCLLILTLSLPQQAGAFVIDGVAAHVNSEVITIGEVTRVLSRTLTIPPGASKEDKARLVMEAYRDALQELISRKLVIHEFREEKLVIPAHITDQRVESIIDEKFGGDRSSLMRVLAKEGMTFEEWRNTIEEQIILSSMRHSKVEQHVSVSPEEVKRFYEESPSLFSPPAGVRVSLIVLKNRGDKEKREEIIRRAESLRAKIVSGEDFSSLARQNSEGTAADKGGDRGWIVPEDALRSELVEALSKLKVGDVSPVIETPEELYLIRKEGVREDAILPLDEVRKSIEQRLRNRESKRLYNEWINRLQSEAYVRIFEQDGLQESPGEKNVEVIRDDESDQP